MEGESRESDEEGKGRVTQQDQQSWIGVKRNTEENRFHPRLIVERNMYIGIAHRINSETVNNVFYSEE